MDGKVSPGENVSNTPHDMDKLAKELDAMSVEDLREEFDILLSEMDENSSCGELLDLYLDAISRKEPQPQHMDAQTSYEHDLKRMKANGKKRRSLRVLLRVGIIAAVIAALMAASVAGAYAKGFDLFDRIAHWTAEIFGLSSADASFKKSDVPPQLQGLKEIMEQYGINSSYLPTYWPEGYEQSKITSSDNPESYMILGTFGEEGNRIILSYVQLMPGTSKNLYNIDDQSLEFYEHNGIKYHIMTNEGGYLAVWTQASVEGCISGVSSYEELIKILDSIGG